MLYIFQKLPWSYSKIFYKLHDKQPTNLTDKSSSSHKIIEYYHAQRIIF